VPERRGSAESGHLFLRQASLAQAFGEAGDDLGGDTLPHTAHDGGNSRLRMRLLEPAQTFGGFIAPSEMSAKAQLEAKGGQAAIFPQRLLGPG
jgi:hypothetical protein